MLQRLVAAGKVPASRQEEITLHAQRMQSTLEEAAIQLGYISEVDLLKYIAGHYKTRFVSSERLSKAVVSRSLLKAVPKKFAERALAFPILFDANTRTLSVVAADVASDDVRQQMQFATDARDVKVYVAREGAIRAAIAKHYDGDHSAFELLLSGAATREVQDELMSGSDVIHWQSPHERVFDERVEPPAREQLRSEVSDDDEDRPTLEQVQPAAPGSPVAAPAARPVVPEPQVAPVEAAGVSTKDYLDTLTVLVTLIEQSDEDRRGHSARVAKLCRQLGERIRLEEQQIQGIMAAALLHRVGLQVGALVTPLCAALSDASRERARRTYMTALRLFESVDLPEETVRAIKHRFERYDGAGFPDRLKGKGIPLAARVLAAAESYVDLTQNRANEQGRRLSAEEACELLDSHKGMAFDPVIVDWLRQLAMGDDPRTRALSARYRALLVDPDPEQTAVLEVCFTQQGYDVMIERDAEGALRSLSAESFDIVISEVQLPDMSGFELIQKAQQGAQRAVPVLFLSALSRQRDINTGLDLGAADYVVKPASAVVVAAKARRIIESTQAQSSGGRGVSGSLQEMSLPDVIQILSNGRKSGRLRVRNRNQEGEMMFQAGSIHDARFGTLEGAEAVYAILKLNEGDFMLDPDLDPVEDKIGLPSEMLLLEGMRRLDEDGR